MAFDPDDALQFHPVKLQGGKRLVLEFLSLAALVVAVPDDAFGVIALDQHDPRGRTSVGPHSSQRHRVGLGQLGVQRLLQPVPELRHRIGRRRGFVELVALVTHAQVGDVHAAVGVFRDREEQYVR